MELVRPVQLLTIELRPERRKCVLGAECCRAFEHYYANGDRGRRLGSDADFDKRNPIQLQPGGSDGERPFRQLWWRDASCLFTLSFSIYNSRRSVQLLHLWFGNGHWASDRAPR